MISKKKLVILPLVATLGVSSLTACSSNNNKSNVATPAASETSIATPSNATKDPYEVTVAFPVFGTVPKDTELVQAEISKITQAKINATVKLMPISIGQWNQQMNLMVSSGEKLDLALTFGADGSYAKQASADQYKPIDELLTKYGEGIKQATGEDFLKSAKFNGKLYGVPTLHGYGVSSAIFMRKDLVDKYNIDVASIHSLDDLEPIFKTIHDNEPSITPLVAAGSLLDAYYTHDTLMDRLGVLPGYDNGLKVEDYYESQEYATVTDQLHRWFQSGYINKDAATTQQRAEDVIKSNKGFSYLSVSGPDSLANASRSAGTEMVSAELVEGHYTTSANVLTALWTIPQTSKNPDRTMMFLNMMYSDKDIVNLLIWGIEGKHYVKLSDNVIDYPTGVDAQTVGYSGTDWLMGNPFLSYTFKTQDPELWNKMKAFNDATKKSKALGFIFNSDPVRNEITALKNVLEQYRRGLETGTLNPADKLPEFISKLKSAGIDKVVAEKQKQLDAWSAANK